MGDGRPDLINVADYHAAAREKLPPMVYDYYAGGAWDEITVGWNERAWDRIALRYRVLRDVSRRDASTTVLGHRVSMPLVLAPTAFHGLAHSEGEVATARAAGAAGTIFIASTLSNRPIEEIVAAATGPVFFQLYVYRDREIALGLVDRAREAGCAAIVLTVDVPVVGVRERDVRNRFRLPDHLKMENLLPSLQDLPADADGSGLGAYVASLFDPSLSWKDLDWLCSAGRLPVLVKGIVHPDDARLAADHGAAAVVVSNHGGRQLDTAPATADVLTEIVEAAGDRLEVLVDGGIRRGSDVVKAVALGARATAVGRPVLWGLAVDGQAGVERVLSLLRDELDGVMGLCGVRSIDEIDRRLLAPGTAPPG